MNENKLKLDLLLCSIKDVHYLGNKLKIDFLLNITWIIMYTKQFILVFFKYVISDEKN